MSFLQLVLLLDKTIEGINSILPIVSYRNNIFIDRLTVDRYFAYKPECDVHKNVQRRQPWNAKCLQKGKP